MLKLPHNAPDGFDWVTQYTEWHLEDAVLHVRAETARHQVAQVTFRLVAADIWRMTFLPPGGEPEHTPILDSQFHAQAIPLTVEECAGGLLVHGGALRLEISRDPWAIRLLNEDGISIFRENPEDIDGLGRPFVLPLGFAADGNGVQFVSQSFHLRPDEHLFGLGEKFTPLDKLGQRIVTWTQDAFGSTSERSHKNIPFLMSTRGYGLLLDSGARITWELGTQSCQSATIIAETRALDAYLIHGSSLAEILERYTMLTGRAAVPPRWTFGLWMSSTGAYRDQATNQALVDGLDTYDVPADVIHLDTWWMKWRMYCDFNWDREAFPDVEAFIAGLRASGLKLSLWEHPYISVESALFDIGIQKNYFVKRPDGEAYVIDYGLSLAPRPDGVIRVASPESSWNARVAIIDLTNPEAYTWFQDLHRPLLRMGVDVFKTDFGEDVPEDAVFFNGQTAATMHNLYPLIYNRCVYEVTEQELGYGVVWSRSGTAGNQRYPVCWSADPAADFASLACTIRGGLSIGLSGVPFWSNDIGGFRGMPTAQLYVRWAQFGLFCSHSRMHGDSPREPWAYGEEALEIVRRYVRLRYQLFPYLYSAAHEASQNGMPIIRAMPLAFPGDPNTHDKDLQYMYGSSLLVAPIYDEGNSRSVYLPDGAWVDYWTKNVYEGSRNLTVHAPLDTLPLFVRAGSVIPMMEAASRVPAGTVDPLILEIYPHAHISGRLYEDEGVTEFSGTADSRQITFGWRGSLARNLVLRFVGVKQAVRVVLEMDDGNQQVIDTWRMVDSQALEIRGVSTANGRIAVEFS